MSVDALLLDVVRDEFAAFVQAIHPKWNIPEFHLQLCADLSSGDDCLISIPPDHAKSTYASVLFTAWWWGKNPDKKVILSVGTPRLVSVFGIQIKQVMENPVYQMAFQLRLRKDSDGMTMRTSIQGGSLIITSKGQSIGGLRADLIMFDDIIGSAEEARSQNSRDSAWAYLVNDLFTRATDNVQRIGIGTRWHEDDPLCRLEAHPEFKNFRNVKYKAISDDGSALWPERHNLTNLLSLKSLLGSRNFAALYQQSPVPLEGNMVKSGWIKYYNQLPKRWDEMVQSWDLTFGAGENSDYCVGSVYARNGSNIYMLHQVRGQWNIIEQMRQINFLTEKYPQALRKLVEKAANGAAVMTMLENRVMGLVSVRPDKSKEDRLSAVLPLYEAGNVLYPDPRIAPWIEDHVTEMLTFPNGKHDDRLDAETQALNYFYVGMDNFQRIEALASM